MKILVLIFDNYTALDIVGPYEVLNKLPGSEIFMVGSEKKVYKDTHGLKISADFSIDEVNHSDILLIPGGFGIDNLLKDIKILKWIREVNMTTLWTVSVCTGSLLLAESGLIDGKSCTTHWKRKEQLRKYNVNVRDERYVQDGKFITSAGVSAGIDMALFLTGKIAGEQVAGMIQLAIEYDPKPPFDCGSPEKVPRGMPDNLNK